MRGFAVWPFKDVLWCFLWKQAAFPLTMVTFELTMFVLFHFPIRRAHTPINNLISPLKNDFPLKSGFFHYHQDLPTLASICTFQLTSCDSLTERPVTLYFPTTNEMSFLPSLPPDRFFREQPIPAHRGWNSRRKWQLGGGLRSEPPTHWPRGGHFGHLAPADVLTASVDWWFLQLVLFVSTFLLIFCPKNGMTLPQDFCLSNNCSCAWATCERYATRTRGWWLPAFFFDSIPIHSAK